MALACALAGAWAAAAAGTRELGAPPMEVFTWRDYAGHHQVWSPLEDDDGLMLFGNLGQLLEFDGAEWRKIPVPRGGFLRGLTRGPDGRIYLGGSGDLGYLEKDAAGGRHFVSLFEQMTPEERDFANLWAIESDRDAVYIETGKRLLRWKEGKFRSWETPPGDTPNPYRLASSGGVVFVHRRGDALWRIAGEKWIEVTRDERIVGPRLGDLALREDGSLLVAVRTGGLFVVTPGRAGGPAQVEKWSHGAEAFLQREGAFTLFALPDGGVLVGTNNAGIVQLAADGSFVRRITPADGLPSPTAHAFTADRAGRVWITMNNGMARLDLSDAGTLFGRAQGLPPVSLSGLERHEDRLHLATGDGVWRLREATPTALENARFERLPGLDGRFYALASTPHGLLAAENTGLHLVTGEKSEPLRLPWVPTVRMFAVSRHEDEVVWAATLRGLARLRHDDGEWQVERPIGDLDVSLRFVFEDRSGAVWLCGVDRGVWRVDFGAPAAPGAPRPVARVHFFGPDEGVPVGTGLMRLAMVGDDPVLFATGVEPRKFDRASGRFVTAEPKTDLPVPPPWHELAWQPRAGDARRGPWLSGRDRDGREVAELAPPALREVGSVLDLRAEPPSEGQPGVLWVAASDGIARLTLAPERTAAVAPAALLRDAVVNDGAQPWPADGLLAHGRGDLVFRYTASAFTPRVEFQSRLVGYDADWSAPTLERTRGYTNLPPGRYEFQVRARDAATGLVGAVATRAFVVPPAWWQTWWARGGLALVGVGLITFGVQFRLRLLRRRAERLESIVTERTRELEMSRAALLEARDAAEAANRAKSTFLTHMSHELRTPLNGILGYAQVLARDPAQTTAARERLRVIVESGEHLLALINDVLDLARVESGKLQLRPVDCSPGKLAVAVGDLVRARCEEKGLSFEVRLAPGLPRLVRTDEQKLRQVLLNLLGNAVKFTERGGVVLRVEPAPDGRLRFAVEDTGRGIAPERIAEIFQPFTTTAETSAAGTGLGLALSRDMVELLGGRLHVASEVGKGSRFWFDLPLPEVGSGSPLGASASPPVVGVVGAPPLLLIADDDATNRAVLRDLLVPLGFPVVEAEDAAATLAAARMQPPAAVLLDLRFPDENSGLEVARRLRADPKLARAKIIAVSASVFESDRHQALAAGCDAFLAKPFKDEQLFALLGAMLGLEWVRELPAPSAVANGAGDEPLPADVKAQLLELARRGDVLRLRARLEELKGSRYAAAATQLDELAAAFQMKRVRELLSTDA